ncbi:Uncharacterized protein OS=Sorangium cellulosum (strain So ce56) GN=sce5710 PE=4 SV=1 [Gemmataceae bacterium]|nr:Uncharacterized protein OS=Sorangium cellulosum (strain So ce56) GN=sce5710 PE=4 SV=1 [Gemmataceae bacterium]VTU02327.1 Uncharacterized protein OS=Sorangium cellulosum (strain So ce56) GN=sce5710 PE=4 SV=1 [Gemmataceae bacterium]
MTEDGLWARRSDPHQMLRFVTGDRKSKRKLRLYGCACCRQVWYLLRDARSRNAIEVAEAYADGHAKLRNAREGARAAWTELVASAESTPAERVAACAAMEVVGPFPIGAANRGSSHIRAAISAQRGSDPDPRRTVEVAHAELLREIFGNPFWPVAFLPEWRTSTGVALAQGMYESRDFSAMPILADALQDAGCGNADILDHCRRPGPHVRGCWVVDLVLGKK